MSSDFDDVTYMYLPTIRAPVPSPVIGSRPTYSTLSEATKSGPGTCCAPAVGASRARARRETSRGGDRRFMSTTNAAHPGNWRRKIGAAAAFQTTMATDSLPAPATTGGLRTRVAAAWADRPRWARDRTVLALAGSLLALLILFFAALGYLG